MNTSIIESEVLSNFCNSQTEGQLIDIITRSMGNLGFSSYGYVHLAHQGPTLNCTIHTNNDEEWINRYTEKKYIQHDPLFARSLASYETFYWGETLPKNITNFQKKIHHEASVFKLSNGITIPIKEKSGTCAHFTGIYEGSFAEMLKVIKNAKREIFLLGNCFHSSLWDIKNNDPDRGKNLLTSFELSLLELISRGKSLWEISKIIGYSFRVTQEQIRLTCGRMGTHSKVQAVTKAFNLKLLKQ